MTTYRVLGLEKITEALREFSAQLVKQSLDKALRKGANLFADEARARAPVDTGKMRADIIVLKDKKPNLRGFDAAATVLVKYKGKQGAKYWRYVEFGTAKMPAKPFMRPAFETQKIAALATIIESIAADIPRIAKQVGGA